MIKLETSCDMGSIKIFNETMSCFFENGIGDLPTIVYIQDSRDALTIAREAAGLPFSYEHHRFLGHFTVRTEAHLSEYDCSDDPIYTFSKGRWFVYLLEEAVILIEKADEDTHA